MKILKKIAMVLGALIAVLVLVGLVLPSRVHVERSIDIAAPACTIFAQVNSFKAFNAWSPWMDLGAEYTYEGPDEGVGAAMRWTGPEDTVGTGSEKIVGSVPCERVDVDLDFGDGTGMKATFTLKQGADSVHVTWAVDGDFGWNLPARYFGLMFDSMIGPDHEKGLANLKALVEKLPKADFQDLVVEPVEATAVTIAIVSRESGTDPMEFAQTLGGAFQEIGDWMAANHLSQAGQPVMLVRRWEDTRVAFDAGIPVTPSAAAPPPTDGAVRLDQTPAGKALKIVYRAPYSESGRYGSLATTLQKLNAYLAAHKVETTPPLWQVYDAEVDRTADGMLVTTAFVLVK